MDYLDAMREARDKELSLWSYKYSVNEDCFVVYREQEIKAKVEGERVIDGNFSVLRDRAAMKAAYDAAQQMHYGNPLARLQEVGRGLRGAGEIGSAVINEYETWSHNHCGNSVFGLAPVPEMGAPCIKQRVHNEDTRMMHVVNAADYGLCSETNWAEIFSLGVSLTSVAHPTPEKTERELLIERIAEATKLASGG